MKTELKTNLSKNKTLLLLSFICLLCGALSCVVGDIFMPGLIGALAALYLFDDKNSRRFSITVSVILLIINLAALLFGLTASLFGLCGIIISLIIAFSFVKGQSKSDMAYVITIIYALFTLIGCLLIPMMIEGEFSLDIVSAYYKELHDGLRTAFIEGMSEFYVASGVEVDPETFAAIFDLQVRLLVAYMLIGGFAVVGLGTKVFGAIVSKYAEEKKHITEWRFAPTNLYAYFYLILSVATIFVMNAESALSVSVINLYYIFLVIFAYVGFNYSVAMLSMRMKKRTAFILIAVITCVFMSLAPQILAILGVMFTIKSNRLGSDPIQ